jgi:hypothetical protein
MAAKLTISLRAFCCAAKKTTSCAIFCGATNKKGCGPAAFFFIPAFAAAGVAKRAFFHGGLLTLDTRARGDVEMRWSYAW